MGQSAKKVAVSQQVCQVCVAERVSALFYVIFIFNKLAEKKDSERCVLKNVLIHPEQY